MSNPPAVPLRGRCSPSPCIRCGVRDARARRAAIVTYGLISSLYAALWVGLFRSGLAEAVFLGLLWGFMPFVLEWFLRGQAFRNVSRSDQRRIVERVRHGHRPDDRRLDVPALAYIENRRKRLSESGPWPRVLCVALVAAAAIGAVLRFASDEIGPAIACVYVAVESVVLAVALPAITKGRLRQLDRAESEITARADGAPTPASP